MKSHVNLIAGEILFGEKPFPIKPMAIPLGVVAAVLVLILVTLFSAGRRGLLKNEVQRLSLKRDQIQLESARLTGEIGAITRQSEAGRELAAQQLAAMRELAKNRIAWSDVLREVSLLVPEGVWLTEMESLEPRPGGPLGSPATKTIRFIGQARSQVAVNQLVSALERSPRYASVALVYSQKSGTGPTGVKFELTAGMR